jgi:hypothetical protein
MMIFKERNLKELITLSFYGKQIFDTELNDLLKRLNVRDDFSGVIQAEVADFLYDYNFPNNELSQLTAISDWMVGMEQIKTICPGFGGEESLFPIRSFDDLHRFPALQKFVWHEYYYEIDAAPLLNCSSLTEIILANIPANEKHITLLTNAGFNIVLKWILVKLSLQNKLPSVFN